MLPYGSKFTPRSTPYHVMELVLQLLRITFRDVEYAVFPFRYSDDFNQTKILIDTSYNKQSEVAGAKPQLVVSHGDSGSQSISTGDVAQKDWFSCATSKTSLVTSSCMVRAIAKNYNDADLLANEVFNFFMACRTFLPGKLTSIQQIQNISMTQVIPFTQDDTMYQGIVSIVYQLQYKWVQIVTPKVLEGYQLYLNQELIVDQ